MGRRTARAAQATPPSFRTSRSAQASGVSPGRHLPPGNSQRSPRCASGRRRVMSRQPDLHTRAIATSTVETELKLLLPLQDPVGELPVRRGKGVLPELFWRGPAPGAAAERLRLAGARPAEE